MGRINCQPQTVDFFKNSIGSKTTGASVRVVGHASMRTRDMDELKHTLANFNVSVKELKPLLPF